MFFFFQAEDGIRDVAVTGVSDVCSSDLNAAEPLGVSVRSPVLPGAREFVEAAEAAGIPRGDYNGRDREQTLHPASSRTLSPRLPPGRLYRLPMDSPRFSAILPRATETCV